MEQTRTYQLATALMIAVGVFVMPSAALAQSQYQVPFSVSGSGGGVTSGGSYSIDGTVGQPVGGATAGSSDVDDIGFWYQMGSALTGVQPNADAVPNNFRLFQNYPNPFNPTTEISYRVAAVSNVSLKVYDILGREVATLVNAKEDPGSYRVKFDASRLASGVYFYRLIAGSYIATRKLVLIK